MSKILTVNDARPTTIEAYTQIEIVTDKPCGLNPMVTLAYHAAQYIHCMLHARARLHPTALALLQKRGDTTIVNQAQA